MYTSKPPSLFSPLSLQLLPVPFGPQNRGRFLPSVALPSPQSFLFLKVLNFQNNLKTGWTSYHNSFLGDVMAYVLGRQAVQEMRVEGVVDSQMVVNNFHMMNNTPGALPGETGNSAVLGNAFIAAYRAHILPVMNSAYRVVRYTMSEIVRALLVGPVATRKPKTIYHEAKRQPAAGNAVQDIGAIPNANRLPLHDVLRVSKLPDNAAKGYFAGNYWRFSPFQEPDHSDTEAWRWTDTFLTPWQAAMTNFIGQVFNDGGPAPDNEWKLCIWSPGFYINAAARMGGDPLTKTDAWLGARKIVDAKPSPYVGTQVSRRYSPQGLPEGK